MQLIPTRHPFRLTAACAIALAVGSGCVGPLRSPDVASDAVGATGAAEARDLIVFRTEGGPIDAAADVGPRLTRADAVRLALLNDPDLQVALAKLKAAEADAKQARLLTRSCR